MASAHVNLVLDILGRHGIVNDGEREEDKMKKLSWTPKRRGKIYCAPACGSGCLWEDYQKQKLLGLKMCLSMKDPKQWRVLVRENGHWYVFLEHIPTKGFLTVWSSCSKQYRAMLSLSTPHAGDTAWSDNETFWTPQKAVDHVLSLARSRTAVRNAVMAKLPK
jgi:hypothetical protein